MMLPHDLETRVGAILAKDRGVPYSEVLKAFSMTPLAFARAVFDLETIARQTNGKTRIRNRGCAANHSS